MEGEKKNVLSIIFVHILEIIEENIREQDKVDVEVSSNKMSIIIRPKYQKRNKRKV
jgi:hypothetical protein